MVALSGRGYFERPSSRSDSSNLRVFLVFVIVSILFFSAGEYQDELQSTECKRCDFGTYQDRKPRKEQSHVVLEPPHMQMTFCFGLWRLS